MNHEWTPTPPTADGWYWWKPHADGARFALRLEGGYAYYGIGPTPARHLGGLWWPVPIPEPGAECGAPDISLSGELDRITAEHPTSGDHAEDGRYCLHERMAALYALAKKYDLTPIATIPPVEVPHV